MFIVISNQALGTGLGVPCCTAHGAPQERCTALGFQGYKTLGRAAATFATHYYPTKKSSTLQTAKSADGAEVAMPTTRFGLFLLRH